MFGIQQGQGAKWISGIHRCTGFMGSNIGTCFRLPKLRNLLVSYPSSHVSTLKVSWHIMDIFCGQCPGTQVNVHKKFQWSNHMEISPKLLGEIYKRFSVGFCFIETPTETCKFDPQSFSGFPSHSATHPSEINDLWAYRSYSQLHYTLICP